MSDPSFFPLRMTTPSTGGILRTPYSETPSTKGILREPTVIFSENKGMSTGAKVAIGIAVLAVLTGSGVGAYFLLRNRKPNDTITAPPPPPATTAAPPPPPATTTAQVTVVAPQPMPTKFASLPHSQPTPPMESQKPKPETVIVPPPIQENHVLTVKDALYFGGSHNVPSPIIAPPSGPKRVVRTKDTLYAGGVVTELQPLESANGRFRLVQTTSALHGIIMIKDTLLEKVIWISKPGVQPKNQNSLRFWKGGLVVLHDNHFSTVQQANGNLVTFGSESSQALWNSGVVDESAHNSRTVLHNNGNLVTYVGDDDHIIWHTDSANVSLNQKAPCDSGCALAH